MTGVFDTIYRTNAWNGRESLSGPGSGDSATRNIAPAIIALAAKLGVQSVLDVACGDGYWMPDLPGYVGIDVASDAIARARQSHPDRAYYVADVRDYYGAHVTPFDLVICRDVIQHHSLMDGLAIISGIEATGSRYLLASTFRGGENVDIETGGAYSPDLEAEPFSLGPPMDLIPDGYGYADPDAIRDPRKYLGLWAL